MKRILQTLPFLFIAFCCQAQFATYDFDGTGTNPTLSAASDGTSCSTGDYYGIHNESTADVNQTYTAGTNTGHSSTNNLLMGQDIDGAGTACLASVDQTATFAGIDITGQTNIVMCFDIAGNGGSGWDTGSEILFSASVDGGTALNLLAVQTDISGSNQAASLDTDCDGTGNAVADEAVGSTFTTYCVALPETGASLDLVLAFNGFDSSGEDFAIDNVLFFSDEDTATGSMNAPSPSNAAGVIASCESPAPTCDGTVAAGDLIITEIMYNPSGTESAEEWFEVCNTTAAAIDMIGMEIGDSGATNHLVASSVSVPAGGCVVFASGASPCGGAADYTYNGAFSLGNTTDDVEIICSGTTIDIVSYGAGDFPAELNGEAIQFGSDSTQDDTENDDGNNWCSATTACGSDFGTPGAANGTCGCVGVQTATGTNTTTFNTGATDSGGDVDALDDSYIAAQQTAVCAAGETYEHVYGSLSWSNTTDEGTITGLMDNLGNTYSADFTLHETIQGCRTLGVQGALTDATNTNTGTSSGTGLQGDAPKPAGIGDHWTENDGTGIPPNQVCMDFTGSPTDVFDVSFWIGDVETSGVNPGTIFVYDESGNLISNDPIPTVEPLATQGTNCIGSSGAGGYDGCGNDETVFISLSSSVAIGTVCIEVGDFPDDDTNPAGSEHISFGGVSTGGTCTVVPVELISFEANLSDDKVLLNWLTATERNNSHFEVEHAIDGHNFTNIGEVRGNGNTSERQSYEYTDDNLAFGMNYYRLKQVDFDGRFEYSEVASVNYLPKKNAIRIDPTITLGTITLTFGKEMERASELVVYDIIGKEVLQTNIPNGASSFELSTETLTSGHYFVKVFSGNEIFDGRFVKR